MYKKIFLMIIAIVLVLAIFLGAFVYFFHKEEGRMLAKKIIQKIEGWFYYEATIHNPSGDMIPDQWDDNIKGEIKKELKQDL